MGAASVASLPYLRILQLDNNNIHCIHKNAFTGTHTTTTLVLLGVLTTTAWCLGLPQLVSLTLHTNNLSSLAAEVITELPRLQSLRLEHNQLQCDCRLQWILDHETLAPLARCAAPSTLATRR